MKRYLLAACAVVFVMTILFAAVEALGVPLLTNPAPWMKGGGALAACVGVGLLVADVLLPVPSSLVMVAHGALFGVAGGTLLSLAGSLGAALVGCWIGRRGGRLLERAVKTVKPDEAARADYLLRRWGALAIIVTRPVPLLAETVALLAGASRMSWGRVAAAALLGSLPPALLYALTGAAVANLQSTALMFVLVILVAGFFWMLGRLLDPFRRRGEGTRRFRDASSFPSLEPQRKENSHGD
ncbi:MAG TPA: VTT domain-containing protein [Pyrinomonadaceae bacterium]